MQEATESAITMQQFMSVHVQTVRCSVHVSSDAGVPVYYTTDVNSLVVRHIFDNFFILRIAFISVFMLRTAATINLD